jgi:hypothetical protein
MKSLLIGFVLATVGIAHKLAEPTPYETFLQSQDGETVQAYNGIEVFNDKWCIYENDGTFFNLVKLRNKDT